MTTTPLPPFPKPDIWSHVVTVWRDGVECQIDQGPRFTSDQMQAYARQARADLEAENKRLREALHRIDSVAVFLPTFDVLHEGGIEAVTQNIVKAISEAVSALEKQP